ncbi:hypothetical protein ACPA9J_03560 [Pseudomonas aeruginosa]
MQNAAMKCPVSGALREFRLRRHRRRPAGDRIAHGLESVEQLNREERRAAHQALRAATRSPRRPVRA